MTSPPSTSTLRCPECGTPYRGGRPSQVDTVTCAWCGATYRSLAYVKEQMQVAVYLAGMQLGVPHRLLRDSPAGARVLPSTYHVPPNITVGASSVDFHDGGRGGSTGLGGAAAPIDVDVQDAAAEDRLRREFREGGR